MSRLQFLMSLVQKLEENISVRSFSQRKRLQKLIYIAQEMGIESRYNFGWYKYGPYSSGLADDGYAACSIRSPDWDKYANLSDLSEHENDIQKFRRFLDDARDEMKDLDEPDLLELLASLLFLRLHAYPPIESKDEAIGRLSQYKPFSEEQAETAWQLLEKYKLV